MRCEKLHGDPDIAKKKTSWMCKVPLTRNALHATKAPDSYEVVFADFRHQWVSEWSSPLYSRTHRLGLVSVAWLCVVRLGLHSQPPGLAGPGFGQTWPGLAKPTRARPEQTLSSEWRPRPSDSRSGPCHKQPSLAWPGLAWLCKAWPSFCQDCLSLVKPRRLGGLGQA